MTMSPLQRKLLRLLKLLFMSQWILVAVRCQRLARYGFDDCQSPWQIFEDNCYLFVTELKSYQSAEQHCRGYSKPGRPSHIASILNDDENAFIRKHWMSLHGTDAEFWTGYNDLDKEGTYTWLDGTPPGYDSWRPGYPVGDAHGNQDCILSFAKLWKEYYCDHSALSVCKVPRTKHCDW